MFLKEGTQTFGDLAVLYCSDASNLLRVNLTLMKGRGVYVKETTKCSL